MTVNKQKLSIQLLALFGLAIAIKLAFIYYSANYDKYALPSFCSINDFIDCDGAARTTFSQFLGIPLAYWGIFFYITVLFLTFKEYLSKFSCLKFLEVFKNPKDYIAAIGSIAFLVSMVMAGISLFVIKKVCLLCIVTYFVDLVIATVAADGLFKNIIKAFKTTFIDFIDGVKNYPKTFIVLLVLVTSFLAYSGITLNFVPNAKRMHSIMKYRKIKYNPYRVKGNELGPKDADVIIELYSDYVCPLCYVNNIMIHQAVKEFKNVKVIHYNYPFDKTCNPYLGATMHQGACFMSKGAIAAQKQGNYWEMASLLYENQPQNMEDLLKLAEKLNFDKDKFISDVNSSDTESILRQEVKKGNDLEINATPTMYINGKKEVGVKPYYKLKEILKENGAK